MCTLIRPLFILACFVLVRSSDLAISAYIVRDAPRTLAYGSVAILALIFVVMSVFGLQDRRDSSCLK